LAQLKEGDAIGLRGPFGHGWPLESAGGRDLVFVAGGLGLAPLRPAIQTALANRGSNGNVVVIYGTRNPQNLIFEPDLHEWRGRVDADCEITVDHAGPEWRGHVGTVLQRLQRAVFDAENATAFVCGPEIMMRRTASGLLDRGVPPEQIYLSLERNMKCAVGRCGHCQFGQHLICKEGPVFAYDKIQPLLSVVEV